MAKRKKMGAEGEGITYDPNNYKIHGDRNRRVIRKSLEECGAGRSILVDSSGTIIAGNGVFEQANKLGLPVRVVESDGKELVVVKRTDLNPTDEKRRKLALMDNSASMLGEFDMEAIAKDFDTGTGELETMGVDLIGDITASEDREVDILEDDGNPDIVGVSKTMDLMDFIDWEERNAWGFPILIDRFPTYEEEACKQLYLGSKSDLDPSFNPDCKKVYIYGSGSITRTNLNGATVAFYTEDDRFECFFNEPSRPCKTMLNVGIATCAGLDFSTYFRWPKVQRLWGVYKALYADRYLMETGFKVMPSIIGCPDDFQFFKDCIPKHAPLSVQIHRKYNRDEYLVKKELIRLWLDEVEPPFLWVYYSTPNRPAFEPMFADIPVVWVQTYMEQKRGKGASKKKES